ncbi:uncharacterized protein LOC131433778 [Malaya genurostris]|uniref:uncharacterized protein LOC131433778 n=1 Tax=Malaya genurostris TaxID=325434 RepID=UPI0026F3AC5B|nr:uncharacterized protein LOC131433778 [Malaya genurostris]
MNSYKEIHEKKRGKILSSVEINKVIDVWRENVAALRGTCKNSHIYAKMCKELECYGILLTPNELRTRINNLSRKYRSEKNKMGKSGGSRSVWAYFETLNEFLQAYKQNNTVDLMDESLVTVSNTSSEKSLGLENSKEMNLEDFEFDEDSEYCVLYTQVSEPISPQSLKEEFPNNDEHSTSGSLSSTEASIPSSSSLLSGTSTKPSSSAKHARRRNIQERLFEMAQNENEKFEQFLKESQKIDQQVIELMKENNQLIEKMINKM